MKTKTKILASLLAVGASAWMLTAQDAARPSRGNQQPPPPPGPPGPGMHGHHPPPPQVIADLDANHDGVIDSQEIANASKALLKLDENGDGKLTREELRPPPPDGMGPPPFDDDDDLPPPPFPPPGAR